MVMGHNTVSGVVPFQRQSLNRAEDTYPNFEYSCPGISRLAPCYSEGFNQSVTLHQLPEATEIKQRYPEMQNQFVNFVEPLLLDFQWPQRGYDSLLITVRRFVHFYDQVTCKLRIQRRFRFGH